MHLMIPFAAPLSSDATLTAQLLSQLKLPMLEALVGEFTLADRDAGERSSLSPPHERAHARAVGLTGADGLLPWGAYLAATRGVDTRSLAWGLLTPVHWHVGTDGIDLLDPEALGLDEADSRALFEAVRPFFESEGFTVAWGGPLEWFAAHPSFTDLPTASIDRVISRNVDLWLPDGPQARLMRRLQNEAQMLFYTNDVNERRESEGLLTVNSFWLSGCGPTQPARSAADLVIDDRLRTAALNQHWAAWIDAWHALDAGPLAALRESGGTLTLCGERAAVRLESRPRGLWRRLTGAFRKPGALPLLETL